MFCWDDLKPFLAVARTGSTLAASRTLKVNQTTVARRVAALEEALGQRLFDRLQSGARLTEAGVELVGPAGDVEAAALAFEDRAMARSRRIAGVVRVSTPESTANLLITPAIAAFRDRYPEIGIELHVDDRMHDLASGVADVAIHAGERPTDGSLVVRRLLDLDWALYAGRSYLARHGAPLSVDDVNAHQVIGWEGHVPILPGYAWLSANAPRAATPCRCNSLTNLLQGVRAGVGLAPLPRQAAVGDPELVAVLPIPRERDSALWLVVHETQRHAPKVRAFMDFIAEQAGRLKAARRSSPAALESA